MQTPEEDKAAPPCAPQATSEPLACSSCRSRKLKCDRLKPACTRCAKVKNDCVYPESRRKPAFKRRNVRELETRLGRARKSYAHILLERPSVTKNGVSQPNSRAF
jgi:hypothetical protein